MTILSNNIRRSKIVAAAIALVITCLSGWGVIHLVPFLEYVGFVGVMAMVMITGPHGGGVIGGFIFVMVNTVTYYFILRAIGYVYDHTLKKKLH